MGLRIGNKKTAIKVAFFTISNFLEIALLEIYPKLKYEISTKKLK